MRGRWRTPLKDGKPWYSGNLQNSSSCSYTIISPVVLDSFCLTRQGIRAYNLRNEVGSKINQAASQK